MLYLAEHSRKGPKAIHEATKPGSQIVGRRHAKYTIVKGRSIIRSPRRTRFSNLCSALKDSHGLDPTVLEKAGRGIIFRYDGRMSVNTYARQQTFARIHRTPLDWLISVGSPSTRCSLHASARDVTSSKEGLAATV